MTIRRIRQYPRPGKLKSVEDIEKYLDRLSRALNEESVQRIKDFRDNNATTGLDDLDNTDLADPGEDAIVYWDDGNGQFEFTKTDNDVCDLIKAPYLSGATYPTLSDRFNLFNSAGRCSGGAISQVGSTQTVNVAAGTGFIKRTDSDVAELLACDWAAATAIAIPTDTIRYIGIEYDTVSGVAQVVTKTTNVWDLDTEFPLGSVINQSDDLYVQNNPWWVTDGITNVIERFQSEGYVTRDNYVGGLIIGVTGTRNPTLTAGTVWSRLNEFAITAKDCTGDDRIYTFYRKAGDAGWNRSSALQAYPVTQYDDATGTLHNMDNNKYANWWVFLEIDSANSGQLMFIYPQNQYNTAAKAEQEDVPVFPTAWYEHGMLIGRITFKKSTDTPLRVASVFSTTFNAALAADHGNLSGLDDNDHGAIYYTKAEIDDRVELLSQFSISDDDFVSFTPSCSSGLLFIKNSAGARWATYNWKVVATNRCVVQSNSGEFEATTGALDGTTGNDNKITVSANDADGKIYLENRMGSTQYLRWTILGITEG